MPLLLACQQPEGRPGGSGWWPERSSISVWCSSAAARSGLDIVPEPAGRRASDRDELDRSAARNHDGPSSGTTRDIVDSRLKGASPLRRRAVDGRRGARGDGLKISHRAPDEGGVGGAGRSGCGAASAHAGEHQAAVDAQHSPAHGEGAPTAAPSAAAGADDPGRLEWVLPAPGVALGHLRTSPAPCHEDPSRRRSDL